MTPEKKERVSNLLKQVSELSDEQREAIAGKIGLINPEGHILSIRNQCLLYFQAGDKPLSVVAGFRQWQKYNRIVSKGQHGYLIMVPSKKQSEKVEPLQDEEGNETFFLFKTVFDISQTEEYKLQEVA